MSLINTEIKPFSATAYHNGKFIDVNQDSLKGKWSVVVFYPADFTFVCPTELEDLADHYAEFQAITQLLKLSRCLRQSITLYSNMLVS